MDKYIILEFPSMAQAELALSVFNGVAAQYWMQSGYTVIDTTKGKAVVGKNSLTGEDNPEALTTAWDALKESPDGTWYFTSPTPDQRFKNWRDYMPEGVHLGEEREMPENWKNENI